MADYPHPDTAASLAEQAAEWLVLQTVDDVTARQYYRQAFARWQAANPAHAAAAQQLQAMLQPWQALQDIPPAGNTLRRALRSKRRTSWAALSALPLILWALWQPAWLADYHSTPDAAQRIALSDGSRLELRGHASLQVEFDPQQRLIEQDGGELLVDVGRDRQRPFIIRTRHGEIRALGTRFIVRDSQQGTELLMLESRVALSQSGQQQAIATAGQHWLLSAQGIHQTSQLDLQEQQQAWQQNLLVVHDIPLPQVLAVLQNHLPGWSRIDHAALADIRVSAVLPLQQPEQSLRLLANTLPALEVRELGPLRLISRRD